MAQLVNDLRQDDNQIRFDPLFAGQVEGEHDTHDDDIDSVEVLVG